MGRREELLERLASISKPIVSYAGPCIAGFDLNVVTAEGTGFACCQAGSKSVEGPVRISAADHNRLTSSDAAQEDDQGIDDEDEKLARAMVENHCEPGKDYFYFLRGEEFQPEFYDTHEEAHDAWAHWAAEWTELDPWEKMETEALEKWVTGLGLDRPAPAKQTTEGKQRGSKSARAKKSNAINARAASGTKRAKSRETTRAAHSKKPRATS